MSDDSATKHLQNVPPPKLTLFTPQEEAPLKSKPRPSHGSSKTKDPERTRTKEDLEYTRTKEPSFGGVFGEKKRIRWISAFCN